jgi:hypothetical protein
MGQASLLVWTVLSSLALVDESRYMCLLVKKGIEGLLPVFRISVSVGTWRNFQKRHCRPLLPPLVAALCCRPLLPFVAAFVAQLSLGAMFALLSHFNMGSKIGHVRPLAWGLGKKGAKKWVQFIDCMPVAKFHKEREITLN